VQTKKRQPVKEWRFAGYFGPDDQAISSIPILVFLGHWPPKFFDLEERLYGHPQAYLEWLHVGNAHFGVLLILEPSIAAVLDFITVSAYHWHLTLSNRLANLLIL
jgi:hypothetical protein